VETRAHNAQLVPGGLGGLRGSGVAAPAAVDDAVEFLAELARAVERDLSTPDHAPATKRAYAHDWADFATFCGRHALEPLPAAPQTLALYLKALETRRSRSPAGVRTGSIGLSLPTLRRRLAAIASRHATAGLETPTVHPLVRKLLRRYSRSRGIAVRKKEPLLVERLPALLMAMPDDLAAARDRALLLLGYAGAFRRSELVALDVEDLRFSKQGLYVWIAAAKNDPRKEGRELYVPRLPAGSQSATLCAVAALECWLGIVGASGPVFRTFDLRGRLTATQLDPGDVARVLRRRAAAAGVAGDFAGHSAAARLHYQRGEEEDPDREHQASDGPALERDRSGLRRGRYPRRRSAVARDHRRADLTRSESKGHPGQTATCNAAIASRVGRFYVVAVDIAHGALMFVERKLNPTTHVVELWTCEWENVAGQPARKVPLSKIGDEQPATDDGKAVMSEASAICWSYGRTLGNIAVFTQSMLGSFPAAAGNDATLPCDIVGAGKFRHGANRWWCRTHQSYWGTIADIEALSTAGVMACAQRAQPMSYVVAPFTIDLAKHAEVGIWCSLPAAIATTDIDRERPASTCTSARSMAARKLSTATTRRSQSTISRRSGCSPTPRSRV